MKTPYKRPTIYIIALFVFVSIMVQAQDSLEGSVLNRVFQYIDCNQTTTIVWYSTDHAEMWWAPENQIGISVVDESTQLTAIPLDASMPVYPLFDTEIELMADNTSDLMIVATHELGGGIHLDITDEAIASTLSFNLCSTVPIYEAMPEIEPDTNAPAGPRFALLGGGPFWRTDCQTVIDEFAFAGEPFNAEFIWFDGSVLDGYVFRGGATLRAVLTEDFVVACGTDPATYYNQTQSAE